MNAVPEALRAYDYDDDDDDEDEETPLVKKK